MSFSALSSLKRQVSSSANSLFILSAMSDICSFLSTCQPGQPGHQPCAPAVHSMRKTLPCLPALSAYIAWLHDKVVPVPMKATAAKSAQGS